ncbi:SDR family NAD(P)-dependent oxidoreductase [Nocardiopsis xinjiangensis]|uniref:SDR family NAD(P)-dependent oxidoreductase n=1 Tax=Nocardiopsis xinjiangensis TaxID=124285 RepID=UPI0004780495|nr:SDR family NAD(P)-dependent oxidoreductase [Nocardiopsis xinjiangensis]
MSQSSPMPPVRPGTALVTGASTGIGAEYARRLAQRGYSLVLVARRTDLLATLAEDLRERCDADVEVLPADLGSAEDTERVAERLRAEPGSGLEPVDLLVNNAGRGDGGPFTEQDPDDVDAMIDINVRSVLRLTRAVLPVQIARRRAGAVTGLGVITVSSLAGEPVVNPGGSVYGAGKKFLTLWSESVAAEVRSAGVSVTVVLPGFVRTDMTRGVQERGLPEVAFVPKEHIVRDSLLAWMARRPRVIPGAQYKTGDALLKMLPRWLVRTVARRMT